MDMITGADLRSVGIDLDQIHAFRFRYGPGGMVWGPHVFNLAGDNTGLAVDALLGITKH
jgi:hypothetical protein